MNWFVSWCDTHLIPDWRTAHQKYASIWTAAFWGGVAGLILVWSAFSDVLPLWLYASVGIIACASIAVARYMKQPGADS